MKRKNNLFLLTLQGFSYGVFISYMIGMLFEQFGLIFNIQPFISLGILDKALVGTAIGVAVAYALKATSLTLVSSVIAGTIGSGSLEITQGHISLHNPDFITCYIVVVISIIIGKMIQDNFSCHFICPFLIYIIAMILYQLIHPYMNQFILWISGLVQSISYMNPIIACLLISMLIGILSITPISAIAIVALLDVGGTINAAIMAGCITFMVVLAVMSIEDNSIIDVFMIAIATGMLQLVNLIRKPILFIPPILISFISGLCVSIMHLQVHVSTEILTLGPVGLLRLMPHATSWILLIISVIIPAFLSLAIIRAMKKLKYMKNGDMKLMHL